MFEVATKESSGKLDLLIESYVEFPNDFNSATKFNAVKRSS